MRLVYGNDNNVAAWVAARIPCVQTLDNFGPCKAIGVEADDGRPLGGVVFHGYQPRFKSIEASFASDSPKWLTKHMVTGILSFPFEQLGCQRVTAATPLRAHTARRFLDKFGFIPEGTVRLGFGDDDAVISGLLASEWAVSRFNLRRVVSGEEGRKHAGSRSGFYQSAAIAV